MGGRKLFGGTQMERASIPSSSRVGEARRRISKCDGPAIRRSFTVYAAQDDGQLPQIVNRRIRLNLQPMLDVRRHRRAAPARDEVPGAHAGALGAVDVDVEVVADEQRLLVGDAEALAQRGEDRRLWLADAVLVGEDNSAGGRREPGL